MGGFTIQLDGDKELMKFFADMPREFGPRVIGDIAQIGASPIRAEARRKLDAIVASNGEFGVVSKKAVMIIKPEDNPTARVITVTNRNFDFRGKEQSIGKIIRHMTVGKQKPRYTKRSKKNEKEIGPQYRGKVRQRGGDFIQSAFVARRQDAISRMSKKALEIIKRRALRQRGISVR